MTNGEKFTTAEERVKAFRGFCKWKICKGKNRNCILSDKIHDAYGHNCAFAWLELEYKEELKPCPFCGSKASLQSGTEDHWILCSNKDCVSALVGRSFSSEEEAIAAWNRRV